MHLLLSSCISYHPFCNDIQKSVYLPGLIFLPDSNGGMGCTLHNFDLLQIFFYTFTEEREGEVTSPLQLWTNYGANQCRIYSFTTTVICKELYEPPSALIFFTSSAAIFAILGSGFLERSSSKTARAFLFSPLLYL